MEARHVKEDYKLNKFVLNSERLSLTKFILLMACVALSFSACQKKKSVDEIEIKELVATGQYCKAVSQIEYKENSLSELQKYEYLGRSYIGKAKIPTRHFIRDSYYIIEKENELKVEIERWLRHESISSLQGLLQGNFQQYELFENVLQTILILKHLPSVTFDQLVWIRKGLIYFKKYRELGGENIIWEVYFRMLSLSYQLSWNDITDWQPLVYDMFQTYLSMLSLKGHLNLDFDVPQLDNGLLSQLLNNWNYDEQWLNEMGYRELRCTDI